MTQYYYERLSAAEQRAYEKCLQGLQQRHRVITVSVHDNDAFVRVVEAVRYDHPELFYVDFYGLRGVFTPLGASYTPSYLYDVQRQAAVAARLEQEIQLVMNKAAAAGVNTPEGYYRFFHNFLMRTTAYHYESLEHPEQFPQVFTAYGALVEQKAVCEGIAKAFKLLCDRVGIHALMVVGRSHFDDTSPEVPHAWNMVKLGSQFCHIDVTWDIGLSQQTKTKRYDYYCMPDAEFSLDHRYEGYPPCNGYHYTYFRENGRLISDVQGLKTFLAAQKPEDCEYIYFKIHASEKAPADLPNRIHSLVQRNMQRYLFGAVGLRIHHNLRHNIYYFEVCR